MQKPSPWHGLAPNEAAELADALNTPAQHLRTQADALNMTRVAYALRCADALATNDLNAALRACRISVAARAITARHASEAAGHSPTRAESIETPGKPSPYVGKGAALRAKTGLGR